MCDSIWSHYLHLERSLRMRRVTWSITVGKNGPHFWNPWTQTTYWLCHFYGATTKIKPCYRQKIGFSHCEGYKVNCACAVSRDLCTRVPQNHTYQFFVPELSIHYTTFMALRRRLMVVLYWCISMLKRFSAAKKPSPVKIGPQNGGFYQI